MISTSSQNTRTSGRERSGVFPIRLRPDSENWIPSHKSRLQLSWATASKPGSRSRCSLRGGIYGPPPTQPVIKALHRCSSPAMEKGIVIMFTLFPLGQIVATPGALAALERAKQTATCFLARHATGDWGELEPTDIAENEYSMAHGFRLLSSYQTGAGEKLWIITEADRSVTTLLLPDEY